MALRPSLIIFGSAGIQLICSIVSDIRSLDSPCLTNEAENGSQQIDL